MSDFIFDGKAYQIPKGLSKIEVMDGFSGGSSSFKNAMIIGRNFSGKGIDLDNPASPESYDPVCSFSKSSAVSAYYGGDSDLALAAYYWALHGGGNVSCLGIANTTKTICKNGTTTVFETNEYGAHTSVISIKSTGNTCTITPPKNVRFIMKNSGTNSVWVRNGSFARAGEDIYLASSDSLKISTVDPVSAKVKKVINHGALDEIILVGRDTSSFTYGNSAFIFQKDDANTEIITYTSATEFNKSNYITLTEGQSVPEMVADTFLYRITDKTPDITDVQEGTSPIPTLENWTEEDGILEQLITWAPRNRTNILVPIINPVTRSAFDTASLDECGLILTSVVKNSTLPDEQYDLSDLVTTMRSKEDANENPYFPVQVIMGAPLGVIQEGSDTVSTLNIRKWTAELNSQDILFCAGGLDGIASSTSFAPAVAARQASGPIAHNLTRDLIESTEPEKRWLNEEGITGEIISAGAIIPIRTRKGLVIAKGVTTLQDQSTVWNNGSGPQVTTSPMQRSMADFIETTLQEKIHNAFIITDPVAGTRSTFLVSNIELHAFLTRIFNDIKNMKPAVITDYILRDILPVDITDPQAGFKVAYDVALSKESNFIGNTMTVKA